jgi:hypothetical protein
MFKQFQAAEAERLKSHFANLCQLAVVDAVVTREELEFLTKLRTEYGLSQEELDYVMENAFSIRFVAPQKSMDRLAQVYDMVRLVVLDDIIDERKVNLCVKVAQDLGFRPHIVGDLIKALVTLPDDETDTESAQLAPDELREILKESKGDTNFR